MLVLSRVVGELISIGDTISVRIIAVNGGNVRFGIEAPHDVNVHRIRDLRANPAQAGAKQEISRIDAWARHA